LSHSQTLSYISSEYSAESRYDWLVSRDTIGTTTTYSCAWHSSLPENVKFFIWQLGHNAFLTRNFLCRRHAIHDDTCPRCGVMSEDVGHILSQCGWNFTCTRQLLKTALECYMQKCLQRLKPVVIGEKNISLCSNSTQLPPCIEALHHYNFNPSLVI